jgi:hypothetical protein
MTDHPISGQPAQLVGANAKLPDQDLRVVLAEGRSPEAMVSR